MKKNSTNTNAAAIVAAQTPNTDTAAQVDTNAAAFAKLLRAYETAHATGADTAAPLYALATAAALSVLKKCIDPQRQTATTLEEKELAKSTPDPRKMISNNGISPALTAVHRGIMADIALLEKLTAAHNAAYALQYNAAGDLVQVVVDKAAEKAAAALQSETLSDGLDLVNAAVVAILEQTAEHATAAPGWMEQTYTARRLCRRVLIKADDTAKWEEEETSPIREVYRAIRREVQNSRAMQTDPRNGYSYIEDTAADPDSTATETIYRRLHKWADLGGFTQSGHYDPHGNAARSTIYTADAQTAADYESILTALNLTDRQATIIRLRMSGYGYMAIGTYLGVTQNAVYNALQKIRAKCEKIGFTVDMWAEMTAEN